MHSPLLTDTNSPLNREQAEQMSRLVVDLRGDQLTWLSGYLAGLSAASATSAVAGQTAASPAEAPEITILYGSQTGHAEAVAGQAAARAAARGFTANVVAMDDIKKPQLKASGRLLVIVSTHGEGTPPDNAIELHELIGSPKAPVMKDAAFSVLALGDSSYEYFCQTGRDFDGRLEALGATRVYPRTDCDVDFEDAAAAWIEGALEAFAATVETREETQPNNVIRFSPPAASAKTWSKQQPYPAKLLDNQPLNGRGSTKETRHIELSLEDSGLHWEPGDSLGVLPENNARDVDDVLAALGFADTESVTGPRGAVALRDALTHDYEITTLTRPFIERWAELGGSGELEALLAEDPRETFRAWLWGRQIIDVIRAWPVAGLTAQDFVERLRRMPPRLYSIASSHRVNPDEVHLTVAAVRYQTHEREREGVASTWLADRLAAGATVPVYIDHNRNFRLPDDDDTPIIMIGPGTGVAPFRAFIEEREARGAQGRNWLFFGDQHFATDFLYQREWLRWRETGVIDRIDVAFSRDQPSKIYVQHRIREQAEDFHAWLEAGAHVYVCGDAEHMAPDVHQALIDVLVSGGGLTADAAAARLAEWQKSKRYQRDVY
ncbi:MAG: assimilatory sulfite reductase (NADPH) flavoprotein subunit [Gammaproteobacteria bacterium]